MRKTFVIGDIHGRRAQLCALLDLIPRDPVSDRLIFLGDLIDRGSDAPGVVSQVLKIHRENPEETVCLRGNHEQMLLDFIDDGETIWLAPVTGGNYTFQQYTGKRINIVSAEDVEAARTEIAASVPPEHIEFFRQMPLYYEDDYALYVHAGLDCGKHPRDMDAHSLLWTRDMDFFKNYRGKPCLFGHTPTAFLPLRGRLGRHGIYIFHSAIGIDTGYNYLSPLSCLELPDFTLYQAYADGHTATHHITSFISEPLRAMRKVNGAKP